MLSILALPFLLHVLCKELSSLPMQEQPDTKHIAQEDRASSAISPTHRFGELARLVLSPNS